tara:strand:- start:1067 stop:1303 length:237 start_codon:yes stop_codon:yes gene_type:complete
MNIEDLKENYSHHGVIGFVVTLYSKPKKKKRENILKMLQENLKKNCKKMLRDGSLPSQQRMVKCLDQQILSLSHMLRE